MNQRYCLLVNSCDAYADCWRPFFTLLSKFWQPYDHAIYLNTETQDFTFPGLTIHSPRVGLAAARDLGWSDRLIRCLDLVPYDFILYLQEDFFIKDQVDVGMVDSFAELMARDGISHIGMFRGRRPAHRSQYKYLDEIEQRANFRITAQAGLWRVSALRSYLRRHESVWDLEHYGTRRAWRRPDSFFQVSEAYDAEFGKPIFPYRPTGVVHGRWARPVVEELFAANDIVVDYSQRGFYDRDNDDWRRAPLVSRALTRLRSIP